MTPCGLMDGTTNVSGAWYRLGVETDRAFSFVPHSPGRDLNPMKL